MAKIVGVQREALVEWQNTNEKAKEQQETTETRLTSSTEILNTVCELVSNLVAKLGCDT